MQQKICPTVEPIHAKVIIPGSKSITNRALLLATLAEGVSELSGIHISDATNAFVHALHQLGIVTQLDEPSRSCIIGGCNGKFPKKQTTVWCENAKTLARFLAVATSATAGVYYFDGNEKIRQQSFVDLLTILNRQGAQIIPNDATKLPFTLIGADTLEGGEILFDKQISTQIISALLMIAPYARAAVTLTLPAKTASDYIDMTCTMMAEFGVLVQRKHQSQYYVPVPQRYQARDYTVEPDFSLAAYFYAAAAVTQGEVTIQPTKRGQSKQADVKFLAILEKMGCRILETHAGLTVIGPEKLQGVEVSMRDFSETFATLAVIAPFAESPTRITHIGHIQHKEVQRLQAIKKQLQQLQINIESGADWIKIFPGKPVPGVVDSQHDYRLGMAFAILGLMVPGIEIANAECVTEVYPDFFNQWNKLTETTTRVF